MRILLVSYYFAPANTMGALRLTRLAHFLIGAGHDVRVIAAADPGWPATLDHDFPEELVLRTSQLDINWLPRRLAALRNRAGGAGANHSALSCGQTSRGLTMDLLRGASWLYTNVLNWPDGRAGWLPYALRAGRQLLPRWQPDLIYASSPPPTCLLVGKLLAARAGVPWIAEFRDRWSDDPYYVRPAWRQALEARLERRIVGSTRAIVTVSEPWAERYAELHGKHTLAVLNGFEPCDYAGRESAGAVHTQDLEIVYTGGIYPGRRDPMPLFQALALAPELRTSVRVHFYGTNPERIRPLAAKAGVPDQAFVHPHVPRAQAVAIQQQADVLLLMQWNDPREQGNLPGKLFEYLGARRPILALGLEDGLPATIICARAAGCVANDPGAIAVQLSSWLAIKRRLGQLPSLPPDVASGFTRAGQLSRLEPLLTEIAAVSRN